MSSKSFAPDRLRIATRESALAMWQAKFVQAALQRHFPGCAVEIIGMTTTGDQITDRPLATIGGKGLFTKELEVALQDDRADLAVHSLKDVPMDLAAGFELAAIMKREDPRDALVSSQFGTIEAMPAGARIGTSSLRRAAQIQARFPALKVLPLRGNVNTRLARLDDGQYDGIVLAAAGLKRLGLAQRIRQILPPEVSLPAAGQGALAIETLSSRADLLDGLAVLSDSATAHACAAERMVSRLLGGNCRAPLAAYAEMAGDQLSLRALAASVDGQSVLKAQASATVSSRADAQALGRRVGQQLLDAGAQDLLAGTAAR